MTTLAHTLRSYVELTKPRVLLLVIFTGLPAMTLAGGGWPAPGFAFAVLLGISLAFGSMTVGNGGSVTDIVFQAVLATVATFAAALFLFRSGKVRVTPKFTRWLLIAMVGYLAFSLVNVILVWTGVLDGWGMRGGAIGVIVGLVAVGLAAAPRGGPSVRAHAPKGAPTEPRSGEASTISGSRTRTRTFPSRTGSRASRRCRAAT